MVRIQVAIAPGPDEVAHFQPALLRQHVRQQRVTGDVERHPQEDIRRPLVQLQRQFPVRDMRLEQAMARRQRHRVQFPRVPRRHDLPPRRRIGADIRDQSPDLVDMTAVRRLPVAPLLAVDGAEIAVLVGPFVPDAHLAVLQPAHVGVAAQEPQQLDDDRSQVELLGGQHRKPLRQIEAHLVAEHAERARAGPVHLPRARIEHAAHQVEILLHPAGIVPRPRAAKPASAISARAPPPHRGGACPPRPGRRRPPP